MDTTCVDQPIVEARANISDLVNAVKLLRRTYFLTRRGRREAAVVTIELGELIEAVGGADAAAALLAAHVNGADAQ